MSPRPDAFGQAMLSHLEGSPASVVLERDDGLVECHPVDGYFAPAEEWPDLRDALDGVSGRVLDVGCGAGRVALYLQERGCEVVGIDLSPGAVEVSTRRGVRDVRQIPLTGVTRALGTFDAVVFAGNNLGLAGTPRRLAWVLRRLRSVTTPDAVIVVDGIDPYPTPDPLHLAYQRRNRSRGREPGQVRLRVRYRQHVEPWFDLLLQSRSELERNVSGTGWRVAGFSDGLVPRNWTRSDGPPMAWIARLVREG